jgi:hypothetical protein
MIQNLEIRKISFREDEEDGIVSFEYSVAAENG